MKKILSVLGFMVLSSLVNCSQTSKADYLYYKVLGDNNKTLVQRDYIDQIEYHIYRTTNPYGGVFVVNHTKELLEIELLKKQLSESAK